MVRVQVVHRPRAVGALVAHRARVDGAVADARHPLDAQPGLEGLALLVVEVLAGVEHVADLEARGVFHGLLQDGLHPGGQPDHGLDLEGLQAVKHALHRRVVGERERVAPHQLEHPVEAQERAVQVAREEQVRDLVAPAQPGRVGPARAAPHVGLVVFVREDRELRVARRAAAAQPVAAHGRLGQKPRARGRRVGLHIRLLEQRQRQPVVLRAHGQPRETLAVERGLRRQRLDQPAALGEGDGAGLGRAQKHRAVEGVGRLGRVQRDPTHELVQAVLAVMGLAGMPAAHLAGAHDPQGAERDRRVGQGPRESGRDGQGDRLQIVLIRRQVRQGRLQVRHRLEVDGAEQRRELELRVVLHDDRPALVLGRDEPAEAHQLVDERHLALLGDLGPLLDRERPHGQLGGHGLERRRQGRNEALGGGAVGILQVDHLGTGAGALIPE
ncbi:hypothetical protein D3C72_578490 [compost metagenome]